MADEIAVTGGIRAYKAAAMSQPFGRSVVDQLITMTGNLMISGVISVGFAAAEAIPVGEVTQPHVAWFFNRDATNFIKIRNGLAGADVLRIYPGKGWPIPLEPTGTYYAIADTAACLLEYAIFSL